jgi:hypothetical protein
MQVSEQQSLGVAKKQHDTAAGLLQQATVEADARLAQVGLLLNSYHLAAALCVWLCECVCLSVCLCVGVCSCVCVCVCVWRSLAEPQVALKARLTALCICTTNTQAALLQLN